MNAEQLKEFALMWAETDGFRQRISEAWDIIENALNQHEKMYVAYSGGKDSVVMLHLVLQQQPQIMVHHYDYGRRYMTFEYEKEINENALKIGVQNYRIETGGNWYKTFFGRIVKQYYQEGFAGCFVGIRKEESCHRRARIEANKSLTSIKEYWPVQNLKWQDIWAYLFINNLPVHSSYLKYGEVFGWDKVRFVTFFDPEFEKFGSPSIDGVLSWRHRHDNV